MKPYETIIRSLVTEKSSNLQSKGQYSFEVRRDATKIDVKHAVKAIYGVEVKDVKISILPKKTRLIGRGRVLTKRPVTKKAFVTLKDKKTIDPFKIKGTK